MLRDDFFPKVAQFLTDGERSEAVAGDVPVGSGFTDSQRTQIGTLHLDAHVFGRKT